MNPIPDISLIRRAVRLVLGEPALGALDYYRRPESGITWGGPFNGQESRQALFKALVACFQPAAIVETGTYLGTTTEFMASAGVPVFTLEGHARNFGFARARLRRLPQVYVLRGDSRTQLTSLFDGVLAPLKGKVLFAYLDAHWDDDLPLAEELEIIFSNCPGAVVMVDDFKTPGDCGYDYDDYGPGRALDESYISETAARHGLSAFFPSTPSAEETGSRRGCVVLSKREFHGERALTTGLLRSLPA